MAKVLLETFERSGIVLDVKGTPTSRNVKYDVTIQSQTHGVEVFTTFKPELAGAAQGLLGQAATARIEKTRNDRGYENLDLTAIMAGAAIGSGVPAPPVPGVPVAAVPVAAVPVAPAPVASIPVSAPRDFAVEAAGKTRHGQFQSALAFVGVLLQAGLLEDTTPEGLLGATIQWAEAGVFYAQTGQSIAAQSVPQAAPVAEPVAVVPPATPTEVVAQVNGELPGAVQVGAPAMPWATAAAS
jgi:hypothetical protein